MLHHRLCLSLCFSDAFLLFWLQNFMADAAGAAQTQNAASTEQAYNSYGGGHGYASAPSNPPSHGGQSGGYGPVYGNSYGY